MTNLTDLSQEARHYRNWIESMFYIVNKERIRVPFLLNNSQLKYLINRTNYDIILKFRKRGFSSEILALWMVDFLTQKNVNAVVISHEKNATKRLLARAKYFFNSLPDKMRPKLTTEAKDELFWKESNNRFWIGTAGQKSFGRGDDISHLHISELPFWDNPGIIDGILDACVKNPRVVIETTANVAGDSFHHLWMRAKLGGNMWTPHFFPWPEDETLTTFPPHAYKLNEAEKELMHKYSLNKSQLYWRKTKMEMMAVPENFPREFPINDTEAFIATGRAVFDTSVLNEWYENSKGVKPKFVGDIFEDTDKDGKKTIKLTRNERGSIRIYKHPEKDGTKERYVGGADPSGGTEKGDFSACVIRDKKTGVQVATYLARTDPDLFAKDIDLLGRYYCDAFMCVESNNYGEAVLNIMSEELQYPNLYFRERFDESTRKRTKKLGWRTTVKTKQILISNQRQYIRDKETSMVDDRCISQHLSYITDNSGKMGAVAGAFDDFVTADSLANFLLETYPHMGQNAEPIDTFVAMPTSSGF